MYFYALLTPCENGTHLMGEVVSELSRLNLHQAKGSYLAMLGYGEIRAGSYKMQDIREILYGGRLGERPKAALIIANGMNN